MLKKSLPYLIGAIAAVALMRFAPGVPGVSHARSFVTGA